ncbi:uncharacterized protein LOC114660799 [Erpetoichthys calabaricus]|uniref:C2H2-type domain-containing protein n=1 Tax=Erpetoichthys calabaricus TaxID=27687 RepID=A0A8C4TQI4_ERPCA|nr:uncharacterized protein LOC114660799 [Erpetoichthys calabaricus]
MSGKTSSKKIMPENDIHGDVIVKENVRRKAEEALSEPEASSQGEAKRHCAGSTEHCNNAVDDQMTADCKMETNREKCKSPLAPLKWVVADDRTIKIKEEFQVRPGETLSQSVAGQDKVLPIPIKEEASEQELVHVKEEKTENEPLSLKNEVHELLTGSIKQELTDLVFSEDSEFEFPRHADDSSECIDEEQQGASSSSIPEDQVSSGGLAVLYSDVNSEENPTNINRVDENSSSMISKNTSFPCPHCKTCFTGEHYLERHVKKTHREQYLELLRNRTGGAAKTSGNASSSAVFLKPKEVSKLDAIVVPSSDRSLSKGIIVDSARTKKVLRITAKDRSLEFKNKLHEDGGKLFCTCCSVVLDHTRRSVIIDHLKSQGHIKREKQAQEDDRFRKKQRTLTTTFQQIGPGHSVGSRDVARDLFISFLEAGIPLEKADHPSIRNFLLTHVNNGTSIPGADGLRRKYILEMYNEKKNTIRLKLHKKKLAIIVEEASDIDERKVLSILAAPMERDGQGHLQPYLLETKFWSTISHSSVAQSVVQILSQYDIDFDDVHILDTDNTTYMRRSYSCVLKGLLTNCIHVTRLEHIVELVTSAFQKPFWLARQYVELFQKLFALPGGIKSRYLQCLREDNPSNIATIPPQVRQSECSSFLAAAKYHSEHFDIQQQFVEKEMEQMKTPCHTLQSLKEMLDDEGCLLRLQLSFISEKLENIANLLGRFKLHVPVATEVVDTLDELRAYLESQLPVETESWEEPGISRALEAELSQLFRDAFQEASCQLAHYIMEDGQPGYEFLKAVRIFAPAKAHFLSQRREDYNVIPGWDSIPDEEFEMYKQILVCGSTGEADLQAFWTHASSRIPALASLALSWVNSVANWADTDRSLGLEKLIRCKRQSGVDEEELQKLTMLFYNSDETTNFSSDW